MRYCTMSPSEGEYEHIGTTAKARRAILSHVVEQKRIWEQSTSCPDPPEAVSMD